MTVKRHSSGLRARSNSSRWEWSSPRSMRSRSGDCSCPPDAASPRSSHGWTISPPSTGRSLRRHARSFEDHKSPRRFEFTLARDLGKTRSQMKSELSAVELAEWRLLYEVEFKEHDEERKRQQRQQKGFG